LAPGEDDAFGEFPAESTLLSYESARPSPAASPPPPEAARQRRSGGTIFPVALIAAFLGGTALGAFLMYRSESSGAPGMVASRPANRVASREPETTLGVGTSGPAVAESSDARDKEVTNPPVPVAPAPPSRAAVAVPSPAETPAAPLPTEPPADGRVSPVPAFDLSGEWTLNTVVESSSLSMYEGLRLGYRLQLEQRGNTLRGSGLKVLENGNALGGGGQTPITVEGTVDGERLRLTFTERGAQRSSTGTFVLFRDGADGLHGRFASDAARSTGRVEARRATFSQLR
jgi:hypothetical protein